MAMKWSDSRRCPKCHNTVKQGHKRCEEHRGADPYWTSTAIVSHVGAKRKRARVGGKHHTRRSDLDELKAEIEARFDAAGIYREPSTESVAAYLRRWHEGRRAELSPAYWRCAGYEIEKHLAPSRLGSMKLGIVDRPAVKQFANQLEEKGLRRKTRANVVGLFRRAMSEAIDDGSHPGPNPATKVVTTPSRPDREMVVWSAEEIRIFLAAIETHELYPIYRLAAATGMRRGEALGMRWSEVDLDHARLRITAALTRDHDGELVLKAPKTAASRRSVGLDNGTVVALRKWRKQQAAMQLAMGESWGDTLGLVFTDPLGNPVKLDRVSRVFHRIVRDIDGVRVCRLHDLRHAAASHLARRGFGLKAVSSILGHSSAAFTADIYSSFFDEQLDEAATVMGEVLDG
jgi:integrase